MIKGLLSLLVVGTLLVTEPAFAQFGSGAGFHKPAYDLVYDEGVAQPRRRGFNCIGGAITCDDNAVLGVTDITVVGGGVGVDITDVGDCATGACFQSETYNTVFAGPSGDGVAAFRPLVDDDIPDVITISAGSSIDLEGVTLTNIADNEVLVGTGVGTGGFTPLTACTGRETVTWNGSVFGCDDTQCVDYDGDGTCEVEGSATPSIDFDINDDGTAEINMGLTGAVVDFDVYSAAGNTAFHFKNTFGSNRVFIYSDGPAYFGGDVRAGYLGGSNADFQYDTADVGIHEAYTTAVCPTANDCNWRVYVDSGSDTETYHLAIDTTDAGVSSVLMGDPAGGNYVSVSEAGVMDFTGTADINLPSNALDALGEIDGTLCGTNEVLEDQGGSWACIATPAGGVDTTCDTGDQICTFDDDTVTAAATVVWAALSSYPTDCSNQFVRGVGDTLNCQTITGTDVLDGSIDSLDIDVSDDYLWTGTHVFTSGNIQLPAGDADPSLNGEIHHDTVMTHLANGALKWYDTSTVRILVDLDTEPTAAEDDYVVSYDEALNKFYMKVDALGGGGLWADGGGYLVPTDPTDEVRAVSIRDNAGTPLWGIDTSGNYTFDGAGTLNALTGPAILFIDSSEQVGADAAALWFDEVNDALVVDQAGGGFIAGGDGVADDLVFQANTSSAATQAQFLFGGNYGDLTTAGFYLFGFSLDSINWSTDAPGGAVWGMHVLWGDTTLDDNTLLCCTGMDLVGYAFGLDLYPGNDVGNLTMTGTVGTDAPDVFGFTFGPQFKADTYVMTQGLVQGFRSVPVFDSTVPSAGSWTLDDYVGFYTSYDSEVLAVGNIKERYGFVFGDRLGSTPTQGNGAGTYVIGFDFEDQSGVTASTNLLAFSNRDADAASWHAGDMTIGAWQAPTSGYELDVIGDLRVSTNVRFANITGSTQCLQVDTNGDVAGSGGACGGAGGSAIAPLYFHGVDCNVDNVYFGLMDECDATRTNVEYTIPYAAGDVASLKCCQFQDTLACTPTYTLWRNTGATAFTCSVTNVGCCEDTTGTVTFAANDEISIEFDETTGCAAAASQQYCVVTFD